MKSKIIILPPSNTEKYGVVEQKKAEIDRLNNQIIQVGLEVEQYTAIVNAPSGKGNCFCC